MSTIIEQLPQFVKQIPSDDNYLMISEMFGDTIQGEGVSAGVLSTFIRLQGCTLQCTWCDTLEVWKKGNPYTFQEIFELFEKHNLIEKFRCGQHLIITGGSPLKQQVRLIKFIEAFVFKYKFKPFIEIENEAVLMIEKSLINLVDQWNNSPKLQNSKMKAAIRIKPEALSQLNSLDNSWFKFVVSSKEDWMEIQSSFLPHIDKNKIIVMPEGQTQQQLSLTREAAAQVAIDNNLKYSDRLHICIWNLKTGV